MITTKFGAVMSLIIIKETNKHGKLLVFKSYKQTYKTAPFPPRKKANKW